MKDTLETLQAARDYSYESAKRMKEQGVEAAQTKLKEAQAQFEKTVNHYTKLEEMMIRKADAIFSVKSAKLKNKLSSSAPPKPVSQASSIKDEESEEEDKPKEQPQAPPLTQVPAAREETPEEKKERQKKLLLALGKKLGHNVVFQDGTRHVFDGSEPPSSKEEPEKESEDDSEEEVEPPKKQEQPAFQPVPEAKKERTSTFAYNRDVPLPKPTPVVQEPPRIIQSTKKPIKVAASSN